MRKRKANHGRPIISTPYELRDYPRAAFGHPGGVTELRHRTCSIVVRISCSLLQVGLSNGRRGQSLILKTSAKRVAEKGVGQLSVPVSCSWYLREPQGDGSNGKGGLTVDILGTQRSRKGVVSEKCKRQPGELKHLVARERKQKAIPLVGRANGSSPITNENGVVGGNTSVVLLGESSRMHAPRWRKEQSAEQSLAYALLTRGDGHVDILCEISKIHLCKG
ncbi:hypothetical protein Tco_0429221 [Tanacetum coccineum]